jgi:hypothetical protein
MPFEPSLQFEIEQHHLYFCNAKPGKAHEFVNGYRRGAKQFFDKQLPGIFGWRTLIRRQVF